MTKNIQVANGQARIWIQAGSRVTTLNLFATPALTVECTAGSSIGDFSRTQDRLAQSFLPQNLVFS